MSNIKQIKQVSIKDNKLKATIEVYNERTADSYQTIYAVNRADDNTCPVNLAARLHLGRDEYAWIDRLLEDLSLCEREALLYITQGKRLGMERFVEIGNTSDEPLNTAA